MKKVEGLKDMFANIPTWRRTAKRRRMQIAAAIREALQDQSMSQKQLADKMNVSEPYVSKLLRGCNLTIDTICRIEEALNITLLADPREGHQPKDLVLH